MELEAALLYVFLYRHYLHVCEVPFPSEVVENWSIGFARTHSMVPGAVKAQRPDDGRFWHSTCGCWLEAGFLFTIVLLTAIVCYSSRVKV